MNEEHNMTLREKWEVYALSQIANHDELNTRDVSNWFLAQFDEMLAEDIENGKNKKIDIEKYRLDLIEFNRCNKSNRRLNVQEKRAFNEGVDSVMSILETRRLFIKK